jgi:ferric-dicitrate binding protein FerR (iron transport regulator)
MVRYIKHGLSVSRAGKPKPGRIKMPLYGRDALSTKKNQGASLTFSDKTVLHLNQLTDAVLVTANSTVVKKGEVDQIVMPGTNHSILTAAAVASAIGTNWDERVKGKTTTISVKEGVVLVNTPKGSLVLKAGQQTTVTVGQAPTAPTTVDPNSVGAWATGYPKANLPINLALDTNGGKIVGQSS